MKAWMALLLATLTFAGCVDDGEPEPEATPQPWSAGTGAWTSPAILAEEGHDHNDPSQHDINNNMTLVGFEPLGPDGPPGAISEVDVAGDWAFLGIMGYGFQIVDISNVTAPKLVTSFEIDVPDQLLPTDVYLADLKTDATGDWLFVALELSTTPGVLIYDVRDKTAPVLAGFWPEPGLLLGCHMVEYAVIGEQEYLFCAPLDNAVYVGLLLPPVDTPAGPVREVAQVARWMPHTPKFAQQQTDALVDYVVNNQDPAGAALHFVSGHQDMTHQIDPLTGADILSVSFWNLGLRFVDVSIPAAPLEIGSWAGEDSEKWDGVLHTSMMFEQDGRRIAVTIPEGGRPPAMFVLDATDLDNPIILSEWTARDDFQGEDGVFSMHNFQIVDGKVYIAMYHGGIWVLDISNPENQAAPQALGTYMPWYRGDGPDDPAYGRGCCTGIMSWDVVVHHGYVLAANDGFYVLRLQGVPVGEEAPSSFA